MKKELNEGSMKDQIHDLIMSAIKRTKIQSGMSYDAAVSEIAKSAIDKNPEVFTDLSDTKEQVKKSI